MILEAIWDKENKMYYVLFNYTKGECTRDFEKLETEADVITFLHEKYKEIDVCQIIEVSAQYRLGLIVTEDFITSTLESKEEEILKENKEKLDEIEEEELTEEEREKKNKALLTKADKQMAAAKKDQRAGWPKCPVCKIRKMAPWNKTGKCSYCQTYKKKKKDDL